VDELTPALARQLGFARAGGAVVTRVVPGSAADRREVSENHRITSIDRKPVRSAAEARALLRGAKAGQVMSLVLEEPEGRTYVVNVRVP
jgi:S1-C subfamily serine protease